MLKDLFAHLTLRSMVYNFLEDSQGVLIGYSFSRSHIEYKQDFKKKTSLIKLRCLRVSIDLDTPNFDLTLIVISALLTHLWSSSFERDMKYEHKL